MQQGDKPHKHYSIADLAGDPSFQEWATRQTTTADSYWDQWIQEHPDNAANANTARQILLQVRFRLHEPDAAELSASYERFTAAMAATQPAAGRLRSLFRFRNAAILSGLIAGAGLIAFFALRTTEQRISTAFGEVRSITLPDRSVVWLRANSELRFRSAWAKGMQREVWITGEGFFDIHPDKNLPAAGFIVHTPATDITVLGTAFDVKHRHNQTTVFLKTGKVRVDFPHRKTPGMILLPGDLITYHAQQQRVSASKADSTYSSWIQGKLLLENAPLSDIIQILEENYGEKIIVSDHQLLQKRIEGTIYLESREDILFIISHVLDIQISHRNDTLYFNNKK
ncbi:DUF4974 domain-containing protein [Chitinophaga sp. Mgbs1]|uniref:DUF4974 domain-containing protein n=1 Tax=Chitinophaga solisilvae TaxID=1233460 RepID=A0A433WLN6_9BACT|nr:DUF4974 domain-containing protein [Chitinophaga solisilvae]